MALQRNVIEQIQSVTGLTISDTLAQDGYNMHLLVTDPKDERRINEKQVCIYFGGKCYEPNILASQLVNQLDSTFIEHHPELQKYAIPLVISDSSLEMPYMLNEYSSMFVYNPSYVGIRDLSVIRILNNTAEQSNIELYRVYHINESLNEHLDSISDMKLNKTYIRYAIKPFGEVYTEWLNEPLWMQSINTILDFYQNPNNEDAHALLKNAAPLYKGLNLWVLANRSLSIFVDGVWLNIPPDSVLPPKYQEEYQAFLNYISL